MSQAVPSQSTASAFYQNTARPKVSKAVLSQSTARPYFPRPVFRTSTGRPYYPRMDNVRPRASSSSPPTERKYLLDTSRYIPPDKGNPEEELKDHVTIDSGCSLALKVLLGIKRTDSPNDYTPTDEVQTSGGDEGNLDLYGLTREVLRLKKLTTKQAAQILRLKTKMKILIKKVKPVITEYRSFVKINATLSKKKKMKKAHTKKSSSFKQGRKQVSGKSTGLNEGDVNSRDAQVNEGTAKIDEGTAKVNEGTAKINEGTSKVHEGTANIHEGTANIPEGTAKDNEGTAKVIEGTDKVNESTAGANLSTKPSMKEMKDEAGPPTFQDESDEFIQDDTLIADYLVNISKNRRGAGITIPGNIPEQERPK
ncbi:hypothetical protein Tco_0144542, partial [Tanacetum coccineum]